MGLGKKRRPDGKKIVELREQKGLKQNGLASDARISERLLRDIERRNKPVPGATITAIATALKVSPETITLESPEAPGGYQQLKLRAFRSAYELSRLADEVHDYWWDLKVNPTAATAKEIKQLLMIIRRIVKRFSVTDEFDNENITGSDAQAPDDFGYIARLARLQESLDTLYAAGVGVLAASHYHSAVTSAADESPGPKFRIRGTEQILNFHGTLEIRFVPSHVDEYEITVDAGISLEDLLHRGVSIEPLDEDSRNLIQRDK